ncbi:hypothetical protein S7711_03674 [Stachybotrys chartarum IBT 7711]|uniref:Glucose-methanol-choline oxidoreductase N-terminal domain-containing protein n=1 Tax=Stachybotrys chartarum (strain CBS 109288 / IBT 7711) TaxID=1280523 RepID=A0A084B7H8_STACB|nr:hypothetical protein S7711_03674 [Stachybotrys chartarum IBT 7711]
MIVRIFDVVIVGGGAAGRILALRLSGDPSLAVALIESANERELCLRDSRFVRDISGYLHRRSLTAASKTHVDAWHDLGNSGWDYDSFATAVHRCQSQYNGLASARSRTNLTIATETTVHKIHFDRSSNGEIVATGVEAIKRIGGKAIFQARKEVILAAGAISSSRLLEHSGIGNVELLQQIGIDCIIDNPHVGENLQDHVGTDVVFAAKNDMQTLHSISSKRDNGFVNTFDCCRHRANLFKQSCLTSSVQLPFPGINSSEGKHDLNSLLRRMATYDMAEQSVTTTPEFATVHELFVRSILTSPTDASASLTVGHACTDLDHPDDVGCTCAGHTVVTVQLAYPLSRGSTHITGPSIEAPNLTEARYLSHPTDVEVLGRHVRSVEQMFKHAELTMQHPKHDKVLFPNVDTARKYVNQTASGSSHYTGTCAMMPREIGGVVDHKLRLFGCQNLRVCDASVMPMGPGVAFEIAIAGVAEMGAALVEQSLSRKES